jgi:transposase-like protein
LVVLAARKFGIFAHALRRRRHYQYRLTIFDELLDHVAEAAVADDVDRQMEVVLGCCETAARATMKMRRIVAADSMPNMVAAAHVR